MANLKGCFLNFTIRIDDTDYVFDFLTLTRLNQSVILEMSTEGFSVGDGHTVLIEEIDGQHIENAINRIAASGLLTQFEMTESRANFLLEIHGVKEQ